MAKFIENVNEYISEMKIKKNFICLKSGIDASKLSRLLSGNQEINVSEMEKIASALGKRIEFFLADPFVISKNSFLGNSDMAFYAGEPKQEQEAFAKKLIELIENVDEILSAKDYFKMTPGEW